jgi:hypothetical protein
VFFTSNKPSIEEHPGPPFNHSAKGAVAGSWRASKNQNHILMFSKSPNQQLY